jgi:hypothetical protein
MDVNDRWSLVITKLVNGEVAAYHCAVSEENARDLARFVGLFMPWHRAEAKKYRDVKHIPTPLAGYDSQRPERTKP